MDILTGYIKLKVLDAYLKDLKGEPFEPCFYEHDGKCAYVLTDMFGKDCTPCEDYSVDMKTLEEVFGDEKD